MSDCEWLRFASELSETGSETTIYDLEKIKEKFTVKELLPDAWIVLNEKDPGHWMEFAVLDFFQSDAGGANTKADIVFYGSGTLGSLRECRHTWWGEDGYVFYPKAKIICAAFKELSKYFDDMDVQ